jgi:hypothetical protein
LDWTVCFQLQAKAQIACTDGEIDCTVSMKTLADGEFGAWNSIGCTADGLSSSPHSLNCVLPVELSSLTAKFEDNTNIVDWTTLSEDNTSHFIISHTNAAGEQKEVGQVTAVGNSQSEVQYRFIHDKPTPGVNYYNLKAVDFDGTIKDHGSIAVKSDFNYAYYDTEAKEVVLTYDTAVEIYSMDGTLIASSEAGTRISFEGQGVFLIRDMNSGFMQRLVTN